MTKSTVAEQSLPACLYCSNHAYSPHIENVEDRLRFVPGLWSFYRCQHCGSAMLSPHPKPTDTAAFYPPEYTFSVEGDQPSWIKRLYAALEYRFYFRPQYKAQVRRVIASIGDRSYTPKGKSLLDIGCGRGLRLVAFREQGFNIHGFDFQQSDVDYLNKKHGISASAGDVMEIGRYFPENSFDVVTAFYILEHVSDVGSILNQCFKLLKPGGWFVCAVPMIDGIQAGVFGRRWLNVTEAPRHLSLPSQLGLKKALSRACFEQVSIKPESLTLCAGVAGLSLFPEAAGAHFYGKSRIKSFLLRALAAITSLVFIPICFVENKLLRRPAHGLVVARKPL